MCCAFQLAFFISHLKNDKNEAEYMSHKSKPGVGMMRKKMKNWAMLSRHKSINSAKNKRFDHYQPKAYFFDPGLFTNIVTKYL